jgi:hypothetical protein
MEVTVKAGTYPSGTKYWKVRYVLPNGKPKREFFPDKQSAENYAASV